MRERIRGRAAVWTLPLAFLVMSTASDAGQAPISFSTGGGDAWTFEKVIESSVLPSQCDEIAIASPAGTMTVRPDGDRAFARVPLESGDNTVVAECRKKGEPNGAPVQQNWFVRLNDVPKAQIHISLGQSGVTFDADASELAPARAAPIVDYEWRARNGNPSPLAGLPAPGPRVVLTPPALDGDYYVTLRVTDAAGRADESTAMLRIRDAKPEAIDPAQAHPAWIDDAVIYGVVPTFFGTRGLEDVTESLDRLAALGVTTLWLSPITASPPGDFGYAVTNYFHIRPGLGTKANLHQLIGAAHARGLRVIIDFVPNHVSDQHAYFIDTLAHARASPYFDFFVRTPTGDAAYYFNWQNLRNLNYDHPEVQRLVIEAFAYWIREFDIDGFRVDVAWGPRERAPDFWPRWRTELKRIKPDLLLLAEASARDPYYFDHGFDAAYDWTEKLGEWAWQAAFDDASHTASRLRAAISRSTPTAYVFRFLNNNDTGARFVTRHGAGKTRLAAAMLLTLPGLPGLYTGDEVGASYEPYHQNHPVGWNDLHGLQAWYARLIALRHGHAALRSREIRMLDIAAAHHVLAYLRPAEDPAESILVLLNFGSEPARIGLPHGVLQGLPADGFLVDLLDGEEVAATADPSSILLAANGVRLLKRNSRRNE